MVTRGRIAGRHFRNLELIGKDEPWDSDGAFADLVAWGYVVNKDGKAIVTAQGKQALRTWRDMKDVGSA